MAKKQDEPDVEGVEESEALTEADEILLDAVWDKVNAARAAEKKEQAEGNGGKG